MSRFGSRLRFSRPELMLCFGSMAVFDVLSRVDDVLRFGIVFGRLFQDDVMLRPGVVFGLGSILSYFVCQ